MQYYPFDSRNPIYKSHIGAVAAGDTLQLRLLLHSDARCNSAFLRIRRDDNPHTEEIELSPKGYLEDYRFYECEISPEEGLYWYGFRYTSEYGDFNVVKTSSSLGIVSKDTGDMWQLTVYERGYSTPDWLCGGIIYQIFPDRFCASGTEKHNVPSDRFLCNNWQKQPEYRQNNGPSSLGNDYYGGDLKGITSKLSYLKELGVSCIYLNPIFEAHSNHRYNTADYMKIDPLLGSADDLTELCDKAKALGISVILDGVFSHTGDDSIYFDRQSRYNQDGAYHNYDSRYHSWYKFERFPDKYSAWWGINTLPETNENDPSFTDFITGKNGVLRYWLKKGIKGWRLDVADELPDEFLDRIRTAIKTEDPDAYLLGEVWEDASNKISYGCRRRFLRGKQLDSVMNYPFAEAIINFVKGADATHLTATVLDILENYPPCSINVLMNHIGTHDTSRILTRLCSGNDYIGDREWQSAQCLSAEEYSMGTKLLRIAAALQYTLPGVPSLYYGDEAGVQGFGDPFCRSTFPWGSEDLSLTEFYKGLGNIRRNCNAFKKGAFIPVKAEGGIVVYKRVDDFSEALIAVNRTDEPYEITLDKKLAKPKQVLGAAPKSGSLNLKPYEFSILTV